MNKNRQIIGELQDFFRHNDASKAIQSIISIMNSLVIQSKVVGPVKNPNCKFTYVQLAKLLILFPFFSIKNVGLYANSGLGQLFSCKKDTFYRFMNNDRTLTARYKQKRGKTVTLIQDSQRSKKQHNTPSRAIRMKGSMSEKAAHCNNVPPNYLIIKQLPFNAPH